MLDALRTYLQAASGVSELTRRRAQELARSLASSDAVGGARSAFPGQVGALAEELLAATRSNRLAVRDLVVAEVESAVTRLGLVPRSELEAALRKVAALEGQLAAPSRGAQPTPPAPADRGPRPQRSAVKKAAATKTATAKAATKTATAKKATAKKATAKKATAKKATAKKATAKKATAKVTRATSGTTIGTKAVR